MDVAHPNIILTVVVLRPDVFNDFLRSAWANIQVVSYEDTAFYQESDSFDLCGGHANPSTMAPRAASRSRLGAAWGSTRRCSAGHT